jgi:hypothetical protein
MNESAKAEPQRILDLGPDSINEDERAFLNARRSYLTEEQRLKLAVAESEEPVAASEPLSSSSSDVSEAEASASEKVAPGRKARPPKAE